MGFLDGVFGPATPGPGGGKGWWFSGQTYSGEKVTVENSLGLAPVWGAISQIAGAVGVMPLPVYRRKGDYRKKVPNDNAWRLLHDEPNREMAADEFWELVDSHIEGWGNAFIWKVPDPDFDAQTGELWVLDPSRVQVGRDENRVREFWIEGQRYTETDILHIRGLSSDGLVGYSPIQLARNSIANAKAQDRFRGKLMKDEGRPSILLKHPTKLSDEAQARLKSSWENVKSGGTAVLEEAITVEKLTMPLEDAQFIEQMNFSYREIALIFNLPPSRLGGKSGDSLTYSTIETENIQFLTNTVQRRLTRIEKALNRDKSIISGRNLFCEFLVDVLLRVNTKERYEAHKIGKEAGFLTVADIRSKENLPEMEEEPVALPSPAPEPAPAPADAS